MDHNETLEPYTAKDFGKDMAVFTAQTAACVAGAYAILLTIGFAYSKHLDRKAKKTPQIEN